MAEIFNLRPLVYPGDPALNTDEEYSTVEITKTVHVPKLDHETFLSLKTYLESNLDLEVEWIPKSDRLIKVTGLEDKVNEAFTMVEILNADPSAAVVPSS